MTVQCAALNAYEWAEVKQGVCFQVAKFHSWKIFLRNHQKSVPFSPSSAMFLWEMRFQSPRCFASVELLLQVYKVSVLKACGVVLKTRSTVTGLASAVAEEPIVLFRREKGMGDQPFFVALRIFCPVSITVYFPFARSYTWWGLEAIWEQQWD